VVRSAYSSYRFCRRIDVGAVIQLTQDSIRRGRLSAEIKERCEQGRIRRTTIGGIFRPDRDAFFAKLALSLLSQPVIKLRPAPLPRGGKG